MQLPLLELLLKGIGLEQHNEKYLQSSICVSELVLGDKSNLNSVEEILERKGFRD